MSLCAGSCVQKRKGGEAVALTEEELVVEEFIGNFSKGECTYEEFCWPHACRTVHVAGSFTTQPWKERVELLKDELAAGVSYRRTVLLPPGEHQFKFIVLDEKGRESWLCDDKLPKVGDGRGNTNNAVRVPEKSVWERVVAFFFPQEPPGLQRAREPPLPPPVPSFCASPPPDHDWRAPGAAGPTRGKRDERARFTRRPGKPSPLGARIRRMADGRVGVNFAVHTDGRVAAMSVLVWIEREPDVSDDPLYDGSPFLLLPIDSPLASSPRGRGGWLPQSVASLLAGLAGGDSSVPDHVLELSATTNRTREAGGDGFVWHVEIADLPLEDGECLLYALLPSTSPVPVIDPYARLLDSPSFTGWGRGMGELVRCVPSPVEEHFDWQGVGPPCIPFADLVIYEMHVAGFTAHPSAPVRAPRGTFRAAVERIPHLVELGVNCVELMPLFEWDEREHAKVHPVTHKALHNYWGYNHASFMAPMGRFAGRRLAALREVKTLVRELHRAGIEVILDVVYNHAGGNSLEALARSHYFITTPHGAHTNYTGCGNTINANHPATLELILESLRFWAEDVHIDGFRFDLAPVLGRGADGRHMASPTFWRRCYEMFTQRPSLRHKKLIVETWELDSSRMGCFWFGSVVHEWNGRYKETVRAFIRGGSSNEDFATRLAGSADYYQGKGAGASERRDAPEFSVNFVTCHDGFTLRDLVSYSVKHNEGNGEQNRDGANDNQAWNCGVEGPTKDPAVSALRVRQMKNFCVALLVSRGVPMMLAGDEYGHTKGGNNNTWNQDNDLNWFDWGALAQQRPSDADLFRFWSHMIRFRRAHPALRRNAFFGGPDFAWHGPEGPAAPFGSDKKFLAFSLHEPETRAALYVAFNPSHLPVVLALPAGVRSAAGADLRLRPWRRIADTALRSPDDFAGEEGRAVALGKASYTMQPYSALILQSFEEGAPPTPPEKGPVSGLPGAGRSPVASPATSPVMKGANGVHANGAAGRPPPLELPPM